MCGIAGVINFENSTEIVLSILEIQKNRGIEGCGVYLNHKIITSENILELKVNEKSNLVLGHNLHSIVSRVFQPIKKKGVLVSNCEIYNWKSLAEKYSLKVNNDSELLIELLDKFEIEKVLEEIDGDYSFAYLRDNKLYLARDIFGVKPLFYFHEKDKFVFASEKKSLVNLGEVSELNPREYLVYDIEKNKLEIVEREFEYTDKVLKKSYNEIKEKTKDLLINAIKKRVPQNQTIGILFSGGIDSTFIAYVLKNLGVKFKCYSAKVKGGNIKEAEDVVYSLEIAKKYNFDLEIVEVTTKELEEYTREVVKTIEDREYIKVSVALPFHIACEKAKKDGVKVIFSGLGSEEIFAGYRRHKQSEDINLECYKGLLDIYKRDLYRDDVITMKNSIELRVPFLDRDLVNFSFKIPVKYKYDKTIDRNKIILRDIAREMGLDEKYSERRKKAAQYGSKFDKGLLRLAKDSNKGKQEFLDELEL